MENEKGDVIGPRNKYGRSIESARRAKATYRKKHREKVAAYDLVYKRRIRDELNAIKLAAGCCDCGYNAHPAALDFDHVRGDKAADVPLCGSIASALEEAKKCVVRCANCHRIRTHERRNDAKHR